MDFETDSVPWLLATYGAKTILAILTRYSGDKDLIVCPSLIPILDMLVSFSILKNEGVQKIHMLAEGSIPGMTSKRLYLLNDNVKSTKIVADQINCYMQNKPKCDVKLVLIYVPRLLKICDALLEAEGVYEHVETIGCPLGFVPFDYDLFVLRQESMFKSFFIDLDQSFVFNISTGLQQLQQLIGPIRNVHAIGKYSKMCLKVLEQLNHQDGSAAGRSEPTDALIDNMLLIDRDVDYIATLLSQLNYEGLLDETLGKQFSKIQLTNEILEKRKLPVDRNNKLTIHNLDSIFRDIRDLHLSTAFSVLKRTGQELKAKQLERERMNISEMKEFVQQKLSMVQNQQKSLEIHINLCEVILDKKKEDDFVQQLNIERNLIEGVEIRDCFNYIEQLIVKQYDPQTVLRLLCLFCITQDGLNYKDYRYLMKLYLQSYGHEHVATMQALRRLELFYENNQTASAASSLMAGTLISGTAASSLNSTLAAITSYSRSSQMRALIRKFALLPPESNNPNLAATPTDPGFVYGGNYIPLVCRFIEYLFVSKPNNFDELIKLLNCPMQTKVNHTASARSAANRKVIMVVFIGGVTYAEVSALRFLAKSTGYKILIASTNTISGTQLVKQTMLEKPE